jgi:RNA polymerase primary sigma factor
LIAGVARLYRPSAVLTTVELMQEGAVGLLRALERYDPELATPFWAYASWWVRQAMQRLVSELTRPVVLSDRAMRQLARVEAAHRAYVQAHRREPTVDQLAAAAGLERAQVEHLIAAARMPRGLDEPVNAAEGSSATLAEQIADPRAEEAYERVPSRLQIARLGGMLASLSERERIVVRARYGLDCPRRTLRELGEQLGVSAERVRQIEERALDNLRAAGVPPARPPG